MAKSVAVFGGVNNGNAGLYSASANELGRLLAARNIRVICSGGRVGLVGDLISGVVEGGGFVLGIALSNSRELETLHPQVTELHYAKTLSERKDRIVSVSDSFIALPGGIGTLDEVLNVMAGSRMGLHSKKIALLNINGFFNQFIELLQHMSQSGFVRARYLDKVIIESDVRRLLDCLY